MAQRVIITDADQQRLLKLIEDQRHEAGGAAAASIQKLEGELKKAMIVPPRNLPREAISMNTRALIQLNGKDKEVSLVYPKDADWGAGRLSIFSPVGTALLGYCEGDSIRWTVPSGTTEIQIKKILYQPEAAGDYHL